MAVRGDWLFPNVGNYSVKGIQDTRYGHGWSYHYNDHDKKIWPAGPVPRR
jgi:hypothetical protein